MEKDTVKNPQHYKQGKFETIELIQDITNGYQGFQAYCIGNAMKYIARAPFKHESSEEDIKKAISYLQYFLNDLEKDK